MNVAVRDAPGVSTPFNLVTDLGPPPDPNGIGGATIGSGPAPAFWFSLNTTYNTQATAAANAATAMTFNRMGILSGPLKHPDGTSNVGGVMTITLLEGNVNAGPTSATEVLATTTIDLTSAAPAQFYWSDPFPAPISIWGTIFTPPKTYYYTFYEFRLSTSPNYSMYTSRPCTVRNGNQWGQVATQAGALVLANSHLLAAGVDLSFINYANLGTASLAPDFALSGHLQSEGHIGKLSGISPQIQFRSRLHTIGDLGTADMEPSVILRATSMAGGPLWKPSKLCSG